MIDRKLKYIGTSKFKLQKNLLNRIMKGGNKIVPQESTTGTHTTNPPSESHPFIDLAAFRNNKIIKYLSINGGSSTVDDASNNKLCIGIIDGEIDIDHKLLHDNVIAYIDFACTGNDYLTKNFQPVFKPQGGWPVDDQNGSEHGTHVASVAASEDATIGVAPGASIIGMKVFANSNQNDDDYLYSLEAALHWTANQTQFPNLKVINLSLEYPYTYFSHDSSKIFIYSSDEQIPPTLLNEADTQSLKIYLDQLLGEVKKKGISIVCASGNNYMNEITGYKNADGTLGDQTINVADGIAIPAACDNVTLAVSALWATETPGATGTLGVEKGSICDFSQRGDSYGKVNEFGIIESDYDIGEQETGVEYSAIVDNSNFDTNPNVVFAAGGSILGAIPGDETSLSDGTSMAAPAVAGLVILLQDTVKKLFDEYLTPDEITSYVYFNGDMIVDSTDKQLIYTSTNPDGLETTSDGRNKVYMRASLDNTINQILKDKMMSSNNNQAKFLSKISGMAPQSSTYQGVSLNGIIRSSSSDASGGEFYYIEVTSGVDTINYVPFNIQVELSSHVNKNITVTSYIQDDSFTRYYTFGTLIQVYGYEIINDNEIAGVPNDSLLGTPAEEDAAAAPAEEAAAAPAEEAAAAPAEEAAGEAASSSAGVPNDSLYLLFLRDKDDTLYTLNDTTLSTNNVQGLESLLTTYVGPPAAIGDPYIQPLNGGDVWKMPNFQGYSRMLQGMVDGEQLTINMETTISSAEEAKESEDYTRAGLKKLGYDIDQAGAAFSITDKGEAFMRNLWIKYGYKSISVDMMKLKVNKEGVFDINVSLNHASFPKYDCHGAESISIKLTDNISVIVSSFDNPQVRTGFSILGDVSKINNASGVLCHKLYKKDMKLNKLKSTKPIKQNKDRKSRGVKDEQWINTNGETIRKRLDIY